MIHLLWLSKKKKEEKKARPNSLERENELLSIPLGWPIRVVIKTSSPVKSQLPKGLVLPSVRWEVKKNRRRTTCAGSEPNPLVPKKVPLGQKVQRLNSLWGWRWEKVLGIRKILGQLLIHHPLITWKDQNQCSEIMFSKGNTRTLLICEFYSYLLKPYLYWTCLLRINILADQRRMTK